MLVYPPVGAAPPPVKSPLAVNVSRWSQLFRKLGVVKGDDIVSEVHRQIFPVIIVEGDRPEHKLLAGERLAWGQYLLAAAGAGVVGRVGIRNPSGSSIIIVVEQVATENAGSNSPYYLGLARGSTPTIRGTEQPRDTRIQPAGAFGVGAPNITGQIVSALNTTETVLPFVVWEFGQNQNAAMVELYPECILAPNDTLYLWKSDGIGGSQANIAVQGSFRWRERATEPGETA